MSILRILLKAAFGLIALPIAALGIFMFGMLIYGWGTLQWSVLQTTYYQLRALTFPTAPGVITKSEAEGDYRYGMQRLDLEYTYVVDGVVFTGQRYRRLPGIKKFVYRPYAQQVVTAHPAGKRVTVCYEPGDPQESLLRPGLQGLDLHDLLLITSVDLIFVIAGPVLLYNRSRRQKRFPETDGLPVLRSGSEIRLRCGAGSALGHAILAAGVVGFFATFAQFFLMAFKTPLPLWGGILTFAMVLGIGTVTYRASRGRMETGETDLVIDLSTCMIRLPPIERAGRMREVCFPLDNLRGVFAGGAFQPGQFAGSAVYLVHSDEQGAHETPVTFSNHQSRAETLANWLHGTLSQHIAVRREEDRFGESNKLE